MDEKTLVSKLGQAEVINDVMAIAQELGKPMTFEEADKVLSKLKQTQNDAAQLSGDTVAKVAKETFGL